MDFNAYAICDTREEADRIFEKLDMAAENLLCKDHRFQLHCGREWTAGGSTGEVKPLKEHDHRAYDLCPGCDPEGETITIEGKFEGTLMDDGKTYHWRKLD